MTNKFCLVLPGCRVVVPIPPLWCACIFWPVVPRGHMPQHVFMFASCLACACEQTAFSQIDALNPEHGIPCVGRLACYGSDAWCCLQGVVPGHFKPHFAQDRFGLSGCGAWCPPVGMVTATVGGRVVGGLTCHRHVIDSFCPDSMHSAAAIGQSASAHQVAQTFQDSRC
jgi:hypothetical protein